MANYSAPLLNASVITTFRTAGLLFVQTSAGNNRRFQVYEIEMGQAGSLASTDIQNLWDLSRIGNSAALVGSSVAPSLTDGSDGQSTSLAIYFNNLTTEPTYTTAGNGLSLKQWPINQRGFNRWRALDDGDNIVIPAVSMNGVGARQLSGSANAAQSAMGAMAYVER
jgi:hypothetical protein